MSERYCPTCGLAEPECTAEAIKELEAEIERLRENVNYLQIADNHHHELIAEKEDEIERLRMELHACGLDNEIYFNRCEELATEIVILRDQLGEALVRENNLRAALERLDRQRQIAERDKTPVPYWAIIEACKALANEQKKGVDFKFDDAGNEITADDY
jgi:chromosome segregation ATPase